MKIAENWVDWRKHREDYNTGLRQTEMMNFFIKILFIITKRSYKAIVDFNASANFM